MKRKKINILLFLCVSVILLAVIMCSCQKKSNNNVLSYNKKIVIATNNNQPKAILNVMQEKSVLEKYLPSDVRVEWVNLTGFSNNRDALISGQIDITSQPASGFIMSIENGYPVRIIANSMKSTSAAIFSNNDSITKVEDIVKAKRVAIQSMGNSYHIAFQKFCLDSFGDAHIFDDKLIVMDYEDMLTSLRTSSDIDIAVIAFPYSVRAEEIDGLRNIYDLEDVLGSYDLGNYFGTSEEFLSNNKILIDAFLKAEDEVVKYMNNNPSETAQLLSSIYNLEPDIIEKELSKREISMNISSYDETAELLYELGVLEEKAGLFSNLQNYKEIPH